MDRRDFLKMMVAGAASMAIGWPETASPEPSAEVVAVRGGTPEVMFRRGIEALGGMTNFVKPGQKVVVKPNIGWDRTPEEGANTNPELVGEIVRQCREAGASKVTVFDHTCNAAVSCYKNSGIAEAARAAGADVVYAERRPEYQEQRAEQAVIMKDALIFRAILEADVVINVPILKNHGGAQMSAAMKNLMGIVWDRFSMHLRGLGQCIADSLLYCRPTLNVVDAYRVMFQNGPRGVSVHDVREMGYQLLSTDIVAVDVLAAKLLRLGVEQLPMIGYAANMGLGVADESRIHITRLQA
ncbi:MAG: DUF362 domain-containing protein [Deltaproteobacteria bacterium]|nr:DUF362 domain-containing protein [Deltaproteobacteria bacterium]